MAAITTLKTVKVTAKLNNGTTASGGIKTANVNLGDLNKSNFDADKAIAIISLLEPCLDKSLYAIEKTEVSSIAEE